MAREAAAFPFGAGKDELREMFQGVSFSTP